MKLPLTQDEKIDYIYNYIRNQRRFGIFKLILKLIIILFIVISLINIYKDLDKENIIENLQETFTQFTYPIIENLLEKNKGRSAKKISTTITTMIIDIIYAILLIAGGSAILRYRKLVKSWTGNFYWAEKNLGTGGTYFIIILIGMGMIFIGALYPFGGIDLFI